MKLSLNGNVWRFADFDARAAEHLSRIAGIDALIAQILTARGIDAHNVFSFLEPKLSNLMPDPYVLKDMQKTAERLAEAVMNKEKIGIIGDYDTDGATSTSVLKMFLESSGVKVISHIPEREEGYGPSVAAFEEFKAFADKLQQRSAFPFETTVSKNDKILTLSTCWNDDEKLVVHAKLIKKQTKSSYN